ncbi:hypothetical protein [Enterobacter kobei]|uniref:hypothetical protein n=1 Tax=Enterobacter kobei TaxID=208224 RepID=UPI0021BEE348|nr:hypothetical protein [Enterobacter kobei]UXJ66759.1 hypothetical protein N5P26_22490 [Enterobacter kobei]
MATTPTQTQLSSAQLSNLALNALRASMFLSVTDPACVEELASRILCTQPSENHSTLAENQLQLDAIKRAIWHAWDMAPALADYRHAYLFDDDLDITPEEALPVLYAKFSQLRTLISCARQLLEPLGTNVFLEDVRQLLGTASDIAGGTMGMRVFDEVAA